MNIAPEYKKLSPLPPIKNLKFKKWIGFDCETYSKKNLFYMVTFYCDKFKYCFFDRKKAIEFIIKHRDYTFIASNLMFDYSVIFGIKEMRKTQFTQSGNLYIKLTYVHSKTISIDFHDTLAFFSVSVAKLGEIVGTPKLEPPFKLGRKPRNNIEKTALKKYCMRDSEISYKFMLYLQEAFREARIKEKNTISSLALEVFKRNYLKETFYVEDLDIIKTTFKGYYGGRTEVFKRGTFANGINYKGKKINNGNVNYYDVNSLYPAMSLKAMPNPNTSFYTIKSSIKTIMKYEGVTKVKIYIPKMYIPPLPYRFEGKLLFPTGTLTGYWTNFELRECITKYNCKILEVYDGTFYKETCYPFKEFTNDIYKKRLKYKNQNNKIEKFWKTILNSLYGKWAYRYFLQNEYLPIENLTAKQIEQYKLIIEEARMNDEQDTGFVTLINTDQWDNPPAYCFPIFSCYTTAYARMHLYSLLIQKQDYLCYCDTDSLMLHSNQTMPTSDKLGDLKLEGTRKKALFIRPKMYIVLKPRIKGVKGKLTNKKMFKIIADEKVEQTMFTKFRTSMKSKSTGKYGIIHLNQIIEKEKKLSFDDTKRKWEKEHFKDDVDGYTEYFAPQDSRPLHFIEGQEQPI